MVPAIAGLLLLAGATTAQAADPTRYVSVSGSDAANTCTDRDNPCRTVQHAHDVATSGDTVRIFAGTYVEQDAYSKSLTIIGSGIDNAILKAPAALLPDDQGKRNVVEIKGPVTVNMTRLTVSGPGPTPCGSIDSGIAIRQAATLNIWAAAVRDLRDNPAGGCQNGEAIRAGTQRSSASGVGHLNAREIQVTNYQKNGVVVAGSGSTMRLSDSTIVTQPSLIIASNGVEIVDGALGTVIGNSISGNECNNTTAGCGPDPINGTQGAGILAIASAANSSVSGNHVFSNDLGIYTDSRISIQDNQVTKNRDEGIFVDSTSSGSQVLDNVANQDGNYGIYVNGAAGNSFIRDTALGNAVYDLFTSNNANTFRNNRCDTAFPSKQVWDCRSDEGGGDNGGSGGDNGGNSGGDQAGSDRHRQQDG